jgi:hypothetical protein
MKLVVEDFVKVGIGYMLVMSAPTLTPKIPCDQKLVNCCLGSLCEEKYIFSNFFF